MHHAIEGCFWFLEAKFRYPEFSGPPVDSENWTHNPPHLGNGTRYEVSYYIRLLTQKSYTSFPLVPKMATLNDLERCYFA